MTKPISFELAKLLKGVGFNLPCLYYYENGKLIEPYLENGSSTDTQFRVELSDLEEFYGSWSKRISAPTVAEAVMWLHEKYQIWIYVSKPDENGWVIHWQGIKSYPALTYFNSPTEAYEAGIRYFFGAK